MIRHLTTLLLLVCLGYIGYAQQQPPSTRNYVRVERHDAGDKIDTVHVGMYFVWVYDFNLPDGSYSTKCWIWFRFKNDKLRPEDFTAIFNAKEYSYNHVVRRKHEGVNWVQVNCTAVVRQKWELASFPFDKQVLRFRLGYEGADVHNLVFVPDTAASRYDEFNHPEGWRLIDTQFKVENRTYKTGFGNPANGKTSTISMFMGTLKIERDGWSMFFKLFTGLYAAFLISWFSLFIRPMNVDPRFALSVGGLFAAVGNKYIVDSIMPDVVKDSLVDVLHGYTFLSVITCICISVISLYFEERGLKRTYKIIDRVGAIAVLLLYTGINAYLISHAISSAPPNFWPK